MPDDLYFSEREGGIPPPEANEISAEFWAGFVALVLRLMADGSLAEKFPARMCTDAPWAITMCNPEAVGAAFRGENPSVGWPLRIDVIPTTVAALDLVEFFWRYVSEPLERIQHDYFLHEHLIRFIAHPAQEKYRTDVNRLLRRNRHPYELCAAGRARRLVPPVLRELVLQAVFRTGDVELDRLLESACEKFRSPDPGQHRESLEKLWDAWERLKTLEDLDKKSGMEKLLAKAVAQAEFRERIDKESRELTEIGNRFMIRHSERDKMPIVEEQEVEYLFHRMFALIWMFLKATGRLL